MPDPERPRTATSSPRATQVDVAHGVDDAAAIGVVAATARLDHRRAPGRTAEVTVAVDRYAPVVIGLAAVGASAAAARDSGRWIAVRPHADVVVLEAQAHPPASPSASTCARGSCSRPGAVEDRVLVG